MNFNQVVQFNFPAIIRFGAGAVNELPAYLEKNKLKKPLIVTDPNIAELGFFKMAGVLDVTPFKTVKTSELSGFVSSQDHSYTVLPISKAVGEDAMGMLMWLGFGEVILAADIVSAPFRLIGYELKENTFKKAKKNIYKALSSGATVLVNNRQYNKVASLLNFTPQAN